MHDRQWVKSSYSAQTGECVEWAPALASAGSVPVQDSKDVGRGELRFSPAAWSAFVTETQRPAK
ncbi:DUF397 domain-containing protein [Streptomyces xiaopingdaonensis]|uniref:DUF397 domain-containing protein n=1 Tax=Streptomyces xiaopingdaonensis TaxID=1565415 RepID=UPI0009979DB8|nr:DUF397 domain-containing protein [Streptomyces xiaopingdaonensis]